MNRDERVDEYVVVDRRLELLLVRISSSPSLDRSGAAVQSQVAGVTGNASGVDGALVRLD
jgi:hypothetical protein